jgi:DNA-binding transcriptional LysR family regulator
MDERQLGAALFQRTSRTVRLTPESQVFLSFARRILREAADARTEVAALRGVVRGRLRIGSIPVSYGDLDLLGLLSDYRRAYPAIDVSLSDEGSLSTVTAVLSGDLDAAFVGLYEHQVPPGLSLRILKLESLVAVVGRNHPLRGAGVVSLAHLADGNPFLESHADSGLRAQVDEACPRTRARRQVVCELRNPADLAALAFEGIGVAVVPQNVAQGTVPSDGHDCICVWTMPERPDRWRSCTAPPRRDQPPHRHSCGSPAPDGPPWSRPSRSRVESTQAMLMFWPGGADSIQVASPV